MVRSMWFWVTINLLYPSDMTKCSPISLFQNFLPLQKKLIPISFYQDPRRTSKRLSSNHFPRLLVLNTQYIKKGIPLSDRKKMEQLIRLERSQFMAKLKRVPTTDKSSSGRKSMASPTGVLPGSQGVLDGGNPLKKSCWFTLDCSCPSGTVAPQFLWNKEHYLRWKVNVTV